MGPWNQFPSKQVFIKNRKERIVKSEKWKKLHILSDSMLNQIDENRLSKHLEVRLSSIFTFGTASEV